MSNILKISDFTLAFGENVLFENFELELQPGIYVFSGPSGVGKSTLMRVIAGLERRHAGTIELNGKVLEGYSPEVHMMHQHYTSFPWLNLVDNTLMVYKGHKVKPRVEDIAEAMEVLERLGLGEHVDKLPSQISGGQDQRLSLASVFINRWSPIILYDEPTSALDNVNDMLVVDMIREHQAKYGTIEIVITHEEHVVQGLEGTILEFSPEFRLRPPKPKAVIEEVPVVVNATEDEIISDQTVISAEEIVPLEDEFIESEGDTEIAEYEEIQVSTDDSQSEEVSREAKSLANDEIPKQSKFNSWVSRIFKKDTEGTQ